MADFEDWDDEDPNLIALSGTPAESGGGITEASDMLMDLICASTKVKWLLKEASESEYRVIRERLAELKKVVAAIPDAARPGRRVGFKVEKKRRR